MSSATIGSVKGAAVPTCQKLLTPTIHSKPHSGTYLTSLPLCIMSELNGLSCRKSRLSATTLDDNFEAQQLREYRFASGTTHRCPQYLLSVLARSHSDFHALYALTGVLLHQACGCRGQSLGSEYFSNSEQFGDVCHDLLGSQINQRALLLNV